MMHTTQPRGFTLIIAVILSSVVVSVGLTLLEITYKQITLASSATQSQYAFYNADTTLECALYWDQQFGAFDFTTPLESENITCNRKTVTRYRSFIPFAGTRRTEFAVPCESYGTRGFVTIDKTTTNQTVILANGYNSCDEDDLRRVERGLKAEYGTQ
jgi:hypothetical protein